MNEQPQEPKEKDKAKSKEDAERTHVLIELLEMKEKIAALEKEIAELRKGPKKKSR